LTSRARCARGLRIAVAGLTLAVTATPAADPTSTPLRGLVVTILAQDGFFEGLLGAGAPADGMPVIEVDVRHVDDIAAEVRASPARYDFVIAHADARPVRALERDGLVGVGTRVCANSKVLIGPVFDPAGIAGADSARDAAARLSAAGTCLVAPARGTVPDAAGFEGVRACPIDPRIASRHGAADVVSARAAGGYAFWGFHPFARLGIADMRAFAIPEPAWLAPLSIRPVVASGRGEEVAALTALITSPEARAYIDAFRLRGHDAVPAFRPLPAPPDTKTRVLE